MRLSSLYDYNILLYVFKACLLLNCTHFRSFFHPLKWPLKIFSRKPKSFVKQLKQNLQMQKCFRWCCKAVLVQLSIKYVTIVSYMSQFKASNSNGGLYQAPSHWQWMGGGCFSFRNQKNDRQELRRRSSQIDKDKENYMETGCLRSLTFLRRLSSMNEWRMNELFTWVELNWIELNSSLWSKHAW